MLSHGYVFGSLGLLLDPLGLLLDLLRTVLASLGLLLDALAYILGPTWPHLGGLEGQYARSLVRVHRIDGSMASPGRHNPCQVAGKLSVFGPGGRAYNS